jgi:hypothetical protein
MSASIIAVRKACADEKEKKTYSAGPCTHSHDISSFIVGLHLEYRNFNIGWPWHLLILYRRVGRLVFFYSNQLDVVEMVRK